LREESFKKSLEKNPELAEIKAKIPGID